MNDTDESVPQVEQKPQRSPAEWISFGIALSILTAIVGLVIYQWFTQKERPPVLSVTSESEIRQASGQFYVPFTVTNTGGQTAELVQVIAELRINGEVEEDGEQHIDFLASGETEEGAFIFSRNPREGELMMRVASYKLP
ncbi:MULTISPECIES: TIGR02588 family protein [unclassified Coleofasciculus]|uniref:TIGR02588 family protein n=1 Tax=unclassified Coleofasciculus TaxID=2692782 RepID=UPI001881702F|nr:MULTISPECIES: TIGR02588 family protein [unclassified Coleofasciculus]MBE9129086.1 TIGR02588 family protein [Coleofasciculus sp. LEGE 07081]MBE9151759.1 TIGR02588 family protein [Coleofasciculus sp. LEGE 07092]